MRRRDRRTARDLARKHWTEGFYAGLLGGWPEEPLTYAEAPAWYDAAQRRTHGALRAGGRGDGPVKLRRLRKHVPGVLAFLGWVLLVAALITGAETAWSFSACAYAWAWMLRDWSKVSTVGWVLEFEGRRASGTADTIDEARRNIAAIHAEWTDR